MCINIYRRGLQTAQALQAAQAPRPWQADL